MQIVIRSLGANKVRINLDFKGERYSETWKRNEDGSCETTDEGIIRKLENDGISAEGTDLEYLLDQIEIQDFMQIAEIEEEW